MLPLRPSSFIGIDRSQRISYDVRRSYFFAFSTLTATDSA